jgi:hypothetical protein
MNEMDSFHQSWKSINDTIEADISGMPVSSDSENMDFTIRFRQGMRTVMWFANNLIST